MISANQAPWDEFLNRNVVLDMASTYVYVGRLVGERGGYLLLAEADAHDLRDSNTSREMYVLDCRRHGVRPNRQQVYVDLRHVVGVSALEDVVEF
ncbi:MAG TPA: hypothetical protein VGE52_02670 [Pirellulales bacterium]